MIFDLLLIVRIFLAKVALMALFEKTPTYLVQ